MALMSKDHMREAEKIRPGCTRRLAKYLNMKNVDEMSDRQVIRLLDWFFKRGEKIRRGLSGWSW